MAKRGATTDINHDNWDDPVEPEEQGSFKPASHEALQKRVIKTAKRRIKTSESNDSAAKPVFAAFTGFKPATPSGANKFSFLGAALQPTNGMSAAPKVAVSAEVTPQQQYLADLQALNRSVSDWIKTHVDSNPTCILTPVFNDYEKHLNKLQEERDAKEKKGSSVVTSAPSGLASFNFVSSSTGSSDSNKFLINTPMTTPVESSKSTFAFSDTSVKSSPKLDDDKPSPLLFGLAKESGKSPLSQDTDSKPAGASLFSSFKSDTPGYNVFSKPDPASLMVNPFTSTLTKQDKPEEKTFAFSNGAPSSTSAVTSASAKDEEEEESDEPPKVEFTPVKEEGSVYSTRCKVFVKKDNNYKERGVGTLFVKKVGEDKHQLLVRAETVLGNVLVNLLLTAAIPTQRMGKNNVMLVCVPSPADAPPPTTVLLRVKTPEEADDLLAVLDKYKQP